jgi:hypothetical protein
MPFKPINLIDAHFQISNIFNHLPIFDEIYYQGLQQEKIQKYQAVREGQPCTLLAVTIIRKDEDFLWDSAEDLLVRSVRDAAVMVRGVFTFDLLTFDMHRETSTFKPVELTSLILNHSLKLKPGEQRLIKYSSSYGLLQKLGDESWGKIVFKSAVEVFNDDPKFLFSLIKRLLKDAEYAHDPLIALVNDVSANPLYNSQDEAQQEFLAKIVKEQAQHSIEFPPEVYIQDKNGVRELLSGTEVKIPEPEQRSFLENRHGN